MGFAAPPPVTGRSPCRVVDRGSREMRRPQGNILCPKPTDVVGPRQEQAGPVSGSDGGAFRALYAYRPDEEAMEPTRPALPATLLHAAHNTEKRRLGKPLPARDRSPTWWRRAPTSHCWRRRNKAIARTRRLACRGRSRAGQTGKVRAQAQSGRLPGPGQATANVGHPRDGSDMTNQQTSPGNGGVAQGAV